MAESICPHCGGPVRPHPYEDFGSVQHKHPTKDAWADGYPGRCYCLQRQVDRLKAENARLIGELT